MVITSPAVKLDGDTPYSILAAVEGFIENSSDVRSDKPAVDATSVYVPAFVPVISLKLAIPDEAVLGEVMVISPPEGLVPMAMEIWVDESFVQRLPYASSSLTVTVVIVVPATKLDDDTPYSMLAAAAGFNENSADVRSDSPAFDATSVYVPALVPVISSKLAIPAVTVLGEVMVMLPPTGFVPMASDIELAESFVQRLP